MKHFYFFIRKQYTSAMITFIVIAFSFPAETDSKKPNILLCIADDASLEHLSAYEKAKWLSTPGFHMVAREGLLFANAYTPNAKCSLLRASFLTGRNPWQLEDAGNHFSYFPAKFTTFMKALSNNGYSTG